MWCVCLGAVCFFRKECSISCAIEDLSFLFSSICLENEAMEIGNSLVASAVSVKYTIQ